MSPSEALQAFSGRIRTFGKSDFVQMTFSGASKNTSIFVWKIVVVYPVWVLRVVCFLCVCPCVSCVCVFSVCVCVCAVVLLLCCGDHSKHPPCVHSTRPRVSVQNDPVYAGTTRTRVSVTSTSPQKLSVSIASNNSVSTAQREIIGVTSVQGSVWKSTSRATYLRNTCRHMQHAQH